MSTIPDAWGSPLFALLAAACERAEAHHAAYERGHRLAELRRAIAGFGEVLSVAHNVDIRSAAMNGLGTALWSRYERFGELSDLDTAVGLFRDALAMYPGEQTPNTPSFHANLSGVLRLRWRRTGAEADLVESVAEIRAALALTPPWHERRAWRLNHLGDALTMLSLLHDDSSALAEAVELHRAAVDAARPGDGLAGMRSNLGEALRLRHRSTGRRDRALLDEAAEQARAAVAIAVTAGDPLLPRFQSNLALILFDRYLALGRTPDLTEATALAQGAVDATRPRHPNRVERLTILSGIRRATMVPRSGEVGRQAAREIVRLAREVTAAVPKGHHLHSTSLLGLGSALAFLAATGDPKALAPAVAAFREVALDPTAAVSARVACAWRWGNAAALGRLGSAQQAYDLAVELLPRAAPRRVTHADRERQLAGFAGLARDAAAFAIGSGDPAGALRLLEHGRGILLGEALDARAELTELRRRYPELADRFVALRDELDRPEGARFTTDLGDSAGSGSGSGSGTGSGSGLGESAGSGAGSDSGSGLGESAGSGSGGGLAGEDRHALVAEWEVLVAQIRGRPGFAGFLRPPPVDGLLAAVARHGPVVVVNAGGLRCDALVLAGGTIRALPLRLEFDDLVERARIFRTAVAGRADDSARRAVAGTLEWLWTTVAWPVLDNLGLPAGARLWWVPTGPFTTLPLHAAGPAGGPGVLDRVVSSYAPTVRSLVAAWDARPASRPAGPLVVALPTTPGLPALPNVQAESAMLTARHPDRTLVTGARAVRRIVLDELPRHPRVHFACHAVSAADGSTEGYLALHDHASAPLTVADIARLRLAGADLAYLSACDTGVGRQDLEDEAVHIAGACHMAGFRHVVGTLWALRDAIAAGVADDFYRGLAGADGPAVALHNAVRNLRSSQPDRPALWAPYIHVGP